MTWLQSQNEPVVVHGNQQEYFTTWTGKLSAVRDGTIWFPEEVLGDTQMLSSEGYRLRPLYLFQGAASSPCSLPSSKPMETGRRIGSVLQCGHKFVREPIALCAIKNKSVGAQQLLRKKNTEWHWSQVYGGSWPSQWFCSHPLVFLLSPIQFLSSLFWQEIISARTIFWGRTLLGH